MFRLSCQVTVIVLLGSMPSANAQAAYRSLGLYNEALADAHTAIKVTPKLNALKVAGASGDIPQNVNFAINGSSLRAFLDAKNVNYKATDSAFITWGNWNLDSTWLR